MNIRHSYPHINCYLKLHKKIRAETTRIGLIITGIPKDLVISVVLN